MNHRLSQLDAFFVAYQQASGASMQLGVELEIEGHLNEESIALALNGLLERWPRLGQRLGKGAFGLRWEGEVADDVLFKDLPRDAWRNRQIDPFSEPSFQVLWNRNGDANLLSFRCHHSLMDGQSLSAMCHAVTLSACGGELPVAQPADPDPFSPGEILSKGKLSKLARHAVKAVRDSKRDSSARLDLDSIAPASIDVAKRTLIDDHKQNFLRRARALRVSPPLLLAAAWTRAIAAHNRARKNEDCRDVSLEIPVSARRERVNVQDLGNLISPVVVYAARDASLADTAATLKTQFFSKIRERAHLAMPLFTYPSRFLPWPIFRRLSANTAFSGFATSHFTWLDSHIDLRNEIAEVSQGRLSLVGQTIYTPVCLHMGAALSAVPWNHALELYLTYRPSALAPEAASSLLDGIQKSLEE